MQKVPGTELCDPTLQGKHFPTKSLSYKRFSAYVESAVYSTLSNCTTLEVFENQRGQRCGK